MKTIILAFCVTILCVSCSDDQPVEKTVVGMFTPYGAFPEKVNKKVKEIRETNFWPVEKDGKIEAGSRLTEAARDTLNWTGNFSIQFNESGLAQKVIEFDENEEPLATWEITNESDFYKSAKRIENDTVVYLQEITKLNDSTYRFEVIDAQTDTTLNSAVAEMDENFNYKSFQFFNSKGEPTSKVEYSYDTSNHLAGYSVTRNDTLRSGMNFTFNNKGFIETQETYNKANDTSALFRYEYEYDNADNWVKSVAIANGKPFMVSIREYLYY